MSSEEKLVASGRQRKDVSLEVSATPLKKKRGRKPRSQSPPHPNPGTLSFFKVLIGDFKDVLFIPPMAACMLKGLAETYVYLEDADGKYWTDALERVDFKIKGRKGRCAKERCATELKPVNFRTRKRKKTAQASEEQHSPSGAEVLRSSKRKKKSFKCDFPYVHVIDSDSISEGVAELSSAGEKPLLDSNSKDSDNLLHDSVQTWQKNIDATVGELNIVSPTDFANSDVENIEAVANKSIINRMIITEKGAALLHTGEALLSKQTAEVLDVETKTATWAVKAHSDNKEGSAEMSGSQVQMNKEHDEMRNNEKMELDHSQDLEILYSEPNDVKMASLSNLKHAECSPEMEFNLIKPEGVDEIVFLSAEAICDTTLDEKLIELATGASFNINGHEEPICQNYHATFGLETSVNPILDHMKDKKENLMSISEEYGVPQTKGSSAISERGLQSCNEVHECNYKSYPEIVEGNDWQSCIVDDAYFDEDEKNVTPCSSRRCRVKVDRTDSAYIPSSSCVSFSVCLSDDVQSSLELQKKMACLNGKLKHERKIIVLQDPSMRCWPILYHQSNKFVGFIGGWVDFVKANDICSGDMCEFELLNKMELKFRVQIMKAKKIHL